MKKFAIEIKWGIIFTIVALLWMFLEKQLGWHDELIAKQAIYTNFFGIIAIIVYVLAIRDKKKNFYQGDMTWTQGFISGMVVSVVVAILSPLAQYISLEVISPEYFPNVIDYAVENGSMTRENAEAYFNLKSYIIQSFFFSLVVGIVTSAIIALFLRSRK
ncbi:DUF4199 domain-containing protein [Christiangramia flava]|uniref:Putative conserved membrane protein n=1 Tax=Christiangramia flava JLT2011 TaxID=1229726 RepID=A0A1L7I7J9_9FLAO|nr:DUF4199 domain-containing protein [Christiangramia flava]APU69075.1 putative conserved membrane protein [Christiangramia flava JLT2011]OSS38324.1 hypothetical protein C723_2808 [Christiangramia flava JLT2011]